MATESADGRVALGRTRISINAFSIESLGVHAKTWFSLATIFFLTLANIMFIVGTGFLAQSAAKLLGDRSKAVWCSAMPNIFVLVLGTPLSQMSEFWGRKWIIVYCSIAAVAGVLIVARASSITMLLAGFGIASMGNACQALFLTIVSEIIARKYRAWAQAVVNTATGLGSIASVLIAGTLLRHNNLESYRIFFYINAGTFVLGVVGLVALHHPPAREFEITLSTRQKLACIDWIGGFSLGAGLLLFTLALSWSNNPYPWKSASVLAPLIIGVASVLTFCIYEWRFKKDGLAHHSLFQHRNFALSAAVVFVEGLAFITINSYFVYELTVVTGLDSWNASLRYLVFFGGSVFITLIAAQWTTKTKQLREPLLLGFASYVIFAALMTRIVPTTNPAYSYGIVLIGALGNGMVLLNVVIAAQLATPKEMIAVSTGFNISARALGGTIGSVVNGAILNNALSSNLGKKIAAAVLPLGFPAQQLPSLIGALVSSDSSLVGKVPGVNRAIAAAGGRAVQESYAIGFKYAWICSASFCALAFVLAVFIINPKNEFTSQIDAPIEKELVIMQEQIKHKATVIYTEDIATVHERV